MMNTFTILVFLYLILLVAILAYFIPLPFLAAGVVESAGVAICTRQ